MERIILILVFLGVLVALPNLAPADCADVGSFSSFSVTGSNTVTLYWMSRPFLKFDVQGGITPTSKLQFTKAYVCDGDDVLVDGYKSTILNVSSSVISTTD
jgi:hypothetical protein